MKTTQRKAMELALEVLSGSYAVHPDEAIAALQDALHELEQEPVPTGATHYQPHQKTYYKRVSATEWYLWSCTGKGWLPSKGTSDSSEWIMLSPIQAHQPAKPAEQEPEYKGWYCAHCERGVDGSEVTFHEQHEVCGRVITYDIPPKPVMQEPVAWRWKNDNDWLNKYTYLDNGAPDCPELCEPLYAAPVRTKDPCNPLQDLTDDEIDDIALESGGDLSGNSLVWFSFHDYYKFARAVIAAYKEKNK